MVDKISYWFINQAKIAPHMIALITPYDQYDIPRQKVNIDCDPFNLNTNDSIDVLMELFSQDFLLGIWSGDLEPIKYKWSNSPHAMKIEELCSKAFIPSREEIRKAIANEEIGQHESDKMTGKCLYYFLTSKGGELWESVFQPRWECALTAWSHQDLAIVNGSDLNIIKKYISLHGWFNYKAGYSRFLIPNTEKCEVLSPWHVKYWKVLPTAYSIRYQISLPEVAKNVNLSQEELIKITKDADDWLKNVHTPFPPKE
jgi:hypothetical protein